MMKTIRAIANEINAKSKGYEIGRLQDLRKELHGFSKRPGSKIFTDQTIAQSWAFHHGGRTELQFNIGFDGSGGKELRHGVAFSFETSQTLPDIAPLRAKAALFNEYLRLNPQAFSHLRMWYWANDKRSEEMLPAPVATEVVREGVFLFMGAIRPIEAVEVTEILRDFDAFLPLYTYVEGGGYSGARERQSTTGFTFKPGCTFKMLATKAKPGSDPVNVALRHNAMQHKLFAKLSQRYGKENVGTEIPTGNGTRIDAVVKGPNGFLIYEIKPHQSPRACIRDSLGQLLEYAHWKSEFKSIELCVVGPKKLDAEAREYLSLLRQLYQLPISYLLVAV